MSPEAAEPWPLQIFRRSVLKQAKYRALVRATGDTAGKRCLDLGSDNGVISYLLRRRGGYWTSADLSEKSVASIRSLVGNEVYRVDGISMPFPDAAFDLVVVVDMLEHVADDERSIAELHRVLRPGGDLVINTPHVKRFGLMRGLRRMAGLTDEWHGHLRPGYTRSGLERLLGERFAVLESWTYSKLFSELLDVALNYALVRKQGDAARDPAKGVVVGEEDLRRSAGDLRLLDRAYPWLRRWAKLDLLCAGFAGYYLLLRARRI